MTGLDPGLQAPARLKLMTMLTAVSEAEFSTLRDSLDVSDSVLSKTRRRTLERRLCREPQGRPPGSSDDVDLPDHQGAQGVERTCRRHSGTHRGSGVAEVSALALLTFASAFSESVPPMMGGQ